MRKMRKYIIWLTVLALVLALAGCGQNQTDPTTTPTTEPTTEPTTVPTTVPTEPPITVEEVYAETAAAMADVEANRLRMELSYDMRVTEGEGDAAETTEISYGMVMETINSTDPFGSYTLTEISMNMPDLNMDYSMEVYLVEENDSVVAYMQMFGDWGRSDYGMSVKEFIAGGNMTDISTEEVWDGGEMPADMTLDEETQTFNGTEVYVLRGSIPAEGMGEALSSLGVQDPTTLEDVTIPVVYYIDAENYTILRMEAGMQFLMDILGDVIAESMLGTETEGIEFDIQISDVLYDIGYGAQEIPALPQEAYDAVENSDSGDIADTEPVVSGPLVLDCGGEQLLITCPDGWTGETFDETNLWVYNADFTLVGDYYYLAGYTEEDIYTYFVQYEIDSLQSLGTYVSHGDGPVIEGYRTMQVIGDGESYYFAWRQAGEGLFLAYVYDYTGTDDPTELLPQMLDLVSPYTE